MVIKTFLFLAASFLCAGEFTANVNTTQMRLNENFSLQLTLKDASPKELPSLSSLKQHFIIRSQQQSSNTTISNGKTSTNITWKFSLSPKTEGQSLIPSITINTTEGPLSTEAIAIQVLKGFAAPAPHADSPGINISTKINNDAPYKNEPFTLSVFLTSKERIYNVQTQKMQIDGAIVEFLEEPKLEERVEGGMLLNIAEFTYLITPLKVGPLTIPSIPMQGASPKKRKGWSGSLLSDDLDPFALIQGFEHLKPFTIATEEIKINVQPPVAEVSPWLTAKSFKIEELQSSHQTLTVGEPFSRSFIIHAEGIKASQLPSLENSLHQNGLFKVYADKPEEQEKAIQGILHSTRKEEYTLIPEKPGIWELPEIAISWWDSSKKEKKTATIAARKLEILPSKQTPSSLTPNLEAPQIALTPEKRNPPILLYTIIGILIALLSATLFWGLALQKKMGRANKAPSLKPAKAPPPKKTPPPVEKEKKEKLPNLNPT